MLFSKAPIAGTVKTRLIPALGEPRATQLHRLMTIEVLSTLQDFGQGAIELWCSPSVSDPFFIQLVEQFPLTLHLQQGKDLGERMMNALNSALQTADMAIVIGSDCLQVTANHIREVVEQLKTVDNVVIIPAVDGGYVLMGLRNVHPELFEGIKWGGREVMETTRERLEQLQWRYSELPAQHDIDEPEDLRHLLQHTMDYDISDQLMEFLETIDKINFS